jgi:uncharacterized membrane protein YhaH (DUF805 family)
MKSVLKSFFIIPKRQSRNKIVVKTNKKILIKNYLLAFKNMFNFKDEATLSEFWSFFIINLIVSTIFIVEEDFNYNNEINNDNYIIRKGNYTITFDNDKGLYLIIF